MYDIIIKNGTIIDGLADQRFRGDVGIKGGEIKKVAPHVAGKAETVIDAGGLFVCPGFIDVHSKSDGHWCVFNFPNQESLLRQGVTTIIGGNCGSSLAPLVSPDTVKSVQRWGDISDVNVNWLSYEDLLSELERIGLSLNFGSLVGHTTLRRGMIKDDYRPLKEDELRVALNMLSEAFDQGAFGVSFGLSFSHAEVADEGEIIAFLKAAQEHNSVGAFHLRDEGMGAEESVEEVLNFGLKTGAAVELSHFKFEGHASQGLFPKTLKMIEDAHSKGLDVNFDVYPYPVTASVLYNYLPDWAAAGGRQKMLNRLRDDDSRQKTIRALKEDEFDYADMIISSIPKNPSFVGKNIGALAEANNTSAEEMVLDMLLASEGNVIVFNKNLSREIVDTLVQHPLSVIATDGCGFDLDRPEMERYGHVHPRNFGAFPEFIRRYIIENKSLSWEEGIKKITSVPASKYGIAGRGILAKDHLADVCIIDPETISSQADFKDPYQYAKGVKILIVNGKIVIDGDKVVDAKAGAVIRK